MNLYRAAAFILLLGVSLGFITFARGTQTSDFSVSATVVPVQQQGSGVTQRIDQLFEFPPRRLRLEVYANSNISIFMYLVDIPTLEERQLILSAENITRKLFDIQIPARGFYAIAVNSSSQSAGYDLHFTLYGLEEDLLQASIGLVMTSTGIALIQYLGYDRRRSAPRHTSKDLGQVAELYMRACFQEKVVTDLRLCFQPT